MEAPPKRGFFGDGSPAGSKASPHTTCFFFSRNAVFKTLALHPIKVDIMVDNKKVKTPKSVIDRMWKIRREGYFIRWDKVKDDL